MSVCSKANLFIDDNQPWTKLKKGSPQEQEVCVQSNA